MGNIIKTLIESVKYKRRETLLKKIRFGEDLTTLSKRAYSNILSYLNKAYIHKDGTVADAYYTVGLVHIKDEALSKILYTKLVIEHTLENEICAKYISVESQQKVVFIVCPESRMEYESLYQTVQNFCNKLSCEELQVHVDYERLIRTYYNREENLNIALFSSIVVGNYNLSREELEGIISEELLYALEYAGFSYNEVLYNVKKTTEEAFRWLKNGVLLQEHRLFEHLPKFLEINIHKLMSESLNNKSNFENYEHFFKDCLEEKYELDNIIFDEDVFFKKLQLKYENEQYVVYLYNALRNKINSYCMKLKNPNLVYRIKTILSSPSYNKYFNNIKLLYTLNGDAYIFWDEVGKDKLIYTTQDIPKVIYTLITTFSNNTNCIKDNIFFAEGTNLLECVCYNKTYGITFTNLGYISFEKQESNLPFEYEVLVIQYLKYCLLQQKSQKEKDKILYSCMKFLSPEFINQFNNYLQTGEYDLEKLKSSLNSGNIIELSVVENVMFLEEINETDILNTAIVFDDKKSLPKNVVSYINNLYSNLPKTGHYGNYSNLRDVAINAIGKKKRITNWNVQSIIPDIQRDEGIFPINVIISKDVFDSNGYTIIGVQLNKQNLYNFAELIKNGALNLKEIYTVIYNLLKIHSERGICIKDGTDENEIMKNIFIDDNLNVLFGDKNILGNDFRMGSSTYYIRILNKFNIIKEVIPYTTMFRDVQNLNQVWNKIKSMEMCSEHGLWHLGGEFCNECQKIYAIYDGALFKNQLYIKGEVIFYGHETSPVSPLLKGISSKTIKLGVQQGLYEKLTPLAPIKMLVQSTSDVHKKAILGILYNNFDFTNVVELGNFKQLQRLKAILSLYNQLYPSILDGSFVCTNPRIYDTLFMSKGHKGCIIIPDILLLETDVILSKDAVLKENKKRETLNQFFNFMYQYINDDETLKLDKTEIPRILNDIKNHKINEDAIKKYLSGKNKYCKVHKINYENSQDICPLCKESVGNNYIVYNENHFKKLDNEDSAYEGGEANLYDAGDEETIWKIFKPEADLDFKTKIIGKAIEKQAKFEQFNKEHPEIQFVCIQRVIYSTENNFVTLKGYSQPFIKDSYKISCLKDKEFVAKNNITRLDVINILAKVCIGIQFLHSIGCFIGDLNGGNILIKGKTVYFIDFDGMSMDDVKNNVYTNMYIYPPSVEAKNITKNDDWYSLAVQAFYYLTYSHPFRGVCNNTLAPINEMERMKQHKSQLGNHGIIPPSVSEGWDSLPKPLIEHFLATFENNKRESMLEVLTMYKSKLEELKAAFKEIVRKYEVSDSISEDLYVDTNQNLLYKEEVILTNVSKFQTYDNCILVQAETTYIVTFDGRVEKFDRNYDFDHLLDIYNGQIFYRSSDRTGLFVDEKGQDYIKTLRIERSTGFPVIDLKVIKENVLLYVEYNNYDGKIALYYNNKCVWQSIKSYYKAKITTGYDKISGKAILILYDETTQKNVGIVMDKELQCSVFGLPAKTNSNCDFYGNVIYWTETGKICCYSVTKKQLKVIECSQATEKSCVRRYGNTFYIGNGAKSYLFTKT